MARVTYVDPAGAPPETAGALARLPRANVFGLMAHARSGFVPWLRIGNAMVNDFSLAAPLRELAILQVGDSTSATSGTSTSRSPVTPE